MRLVFATHNQGKIKEMRQLLADLPIEVLSAEEAGVYAAPEETGDTFEANALIKARFVTDKTGDWAVADDSGLGITALQGQPGVLSSRWAGENATAEQMVAHTLNQLAGVPPQKRQADFETAVVVTSPTGQHWTFPGRISGSIAQQPTGQPRPHLEYDVIFIPEGSQLTFAEMSDEQKNSLSHRGRAFILLRTFLQKTLDNSSQKNHS